MDSSSSPANDYDIRLIRKVKSGDQEAFATLLGKYNKLVERKVREKPIPGIDIEDARQEFTMFFYDAIMSYDENGASFMTHAYRTLNYGYTAIIKRLTRLKRKIVFEPMSSLDTDSMTIYRAEQECEYALGDCVEDRKATNMFREVMIGGSLPDFNETELEVFHMMSEGMNNIEIGKSLTITATRASYIRQNVLKKLQKSGECLVNSL